MNGDPNRVEEAARTALPLDRRRDIWLEQRLGYLIGEQARLKGGVPLRRFLRGAVAAYRRFLFTADPAHRVHCWAILQAVSAQLDQLEYRADRAEVAGSALDGLGPGPSLTAGLTDQPT